jgi:hypothetical protein
MTPDLPVAANTLLRQLREHVPAWSVAEPRHATGPLAFGGLSEQTDAPTHAAAIAAVSVTDTDKKEVAA